jgi:hypothetical protein
MREKKPENEDQVKLKPFLGIRPGVYLTVLYSIILASLFFFLLVFPGFKNASAALVVKTDPTGAAIRVNDVYMGLAGSRIVIPAGTYTITAVMPGFESISAIHQIPGRVFGSLFFPRPYKIDLTLNTDNPVSTYTQYAADFAKWSFGGEPTEAWQIPLSLSEGTYRIGTVEREKLEKEMEQLQQILIAASRFTVTRAALRDLIRAKILLDNYGNSPSPSSLIGSISDTLAFLSANPGSAVWLSQLLTGNTASEIRTSSWANNEFDAQTDFFPYFEENRFGRLPARFELAGLSFTRMPAGRLLNSGWASTFRPFGHNVYINSFMISENPVPQSLFETFLNETPQWREHKKDYFPEEISVNPLETGRRTAITGITWFAAEAFCKWLSGRLPPSMADMEIRLPTENEWEYAALSINSMSRQGWEWCADPYAPLQFIKADYEAKNTLGSPERSLRGRQSSNSAETRASLPPDFSSPFVTFRPVIAGKR